MKITIICVGKLKEKYFTEAVEEYKKRLSRYCRLDIMEVGDEKTPEGAGENLEKQIKKKEGQRILDKIPAGTYVVALAIQGEMVSSEGLAQRIKGWEVSGISHLVLLIGGSLGLSEEVLSRADWELSFSKMTFPHQLMRVILLEQIYRSYRIIKGEPYHK